jgi:hypothetical protein
MSVNLSPLAGAGWQLFDNNGIPLAGGKLESYLAGTTTPAATYTTSAGTIPNSNPVILDSSGRVAEEIWLTGGLTYKFILKDANNSIIWSKDNISGINDFTGLLYAADLANTSDPAKGDALVGFRQSNLSGNLTGSIGKTVHQKFQDYISVFDFLTTAQITAVQAQTSTEDLSSQIQFAIATGKAVYFPAGTYLCNATINNKTILFGDGSHISKLKAYNTALPIMLYGPLTHTTPSPTINWSYHSVVRELGFEGVLTAGVPTGIGFAFGSASPSTYVSGAEFANNVSFYNCFFQYLNKGVMFPFGNIGSQFYACGFQSNYYGVYSKSNNSGSGSSMHAGNKYFYNGEFSGNTCAVYFDNEVDGFGGVAFTDVIFEANINAVYIDDRTNSTFIPPMFKDCWNEANGSLCPTPGDAIVDTWIGGTQGSSNIGRYVYVFTTRQVVMDGGFVSGIAIGGTTFVHVKNARVEVAFGLSGQDFGVSTANSAIEFENCYSGSGFTVINPQCINVGVNHVIFPTVTDTFYSSARAYYIPVSYNKSSSTALSGLSNNFTGAVAYTGSISGTGTVVSGGTKFATCNSYSMAFANQSQYAVLTGLDNSCLSGSWYVATVDAICTSGLIQIEVSDLGSNQMGIKPVPASSRWNTVAYIGYFPNTVTMSLIVRPYGTAGVGTNTFSIGGYQIYKFPSSVLAEFFIAQNNFVS